MIAVSDKDIASSAFTMDLLPLDSSVQLQSTRDQMRQVATCIINLRNTAAAINKRTEGNASDLLIFGKEISSLTKIPGQLSDWGTGGNRTLENLKPRLKSLYPLFTAVAQGLEQHAQQEEEDVVEKFNEFIDLLTAFKDLCERHEISSSSEERAVNRIKKKYSMNPHPSNNPEAQLEQVEQRSQFSLFCIHLETQLLHSYMEVLIHILHSMVTLQLQGLNKTTSIWEQMCPLVEILVPTGNSPRNTPSPVSLSR